MIADGGSVYTFAAVNMTPEKISIASFPGKVVA